MLDTKALISEDGIMKPRTITKELALYLIRWQLSTPILAVCLIWLANMGELWATIIANLIGGLIFFWVDRLIFREGRKGA